MPSLSNDVFMEFGSLLAYCPKKRDGENFAKARNFMVCIKQDAFLRSGKTTSEQIVDYIISNLDSLPFKQLFGPDVLLVPVPKSSLIAKGYLWVPERISRALANKNLGIHVPLLERVTGVPKSSSSKPKDRPKAKTHYDSLKVNTTPYRPGKILLIDDIITQGATMVGCAKRLKDLFPDADISGFAAMRSIYKPETFSNFIDPCRGVIKFFPSSGLTFREDSA